MDILSTDTGSKGRPRVLLLAYACSPYRGSEPGCGWHRALEISKYFDTWVLCKKQKYEDDINRYVAETGQVPGLTFCFVDRTKFEKILKKIPGLFYVAYNLWHRRAYRAAVELNKQHQFDLVHQVNMCGFREPGYLWKLNVPFVWGPVGGTENYPFSFIAKAGVIGGIVELGRNLLNSTQLRFSLRIRKAAKRAAVVLAANSVTERNFRKILGVNTVHLPDVGTTTTHQRLSERGKDCGTLRILWVGSFLHCKALHLLLEALAQVPPSIRYKLRVLGEGPVGGRWRKQANRVGIAECCEWLGWVPREKVMESYAWAHVLVFTSLRETCGTVVTEALSQGLPIVCFDCNGVGDAVTNNSGVKIPLSTPSEVIGRLRDSIMSLQADTSQLDALSRGAVLRAREFAWAEQGRLISEIYRRILATSSNCEIPESRNKEEGRVRVERTP